MTIRRIIINNNLIESVERYTKPEKKNNKGIPKKKAVPGRLQEQMCETPALANQGPIELRSELSCRA